MHSKWPCWDDRSVFGNIRGSVVGSCPSSPGALGALSPLVTPLCEFPTHVCGTFAVGHGRSQSCMSLSSYDKYLSGSTSGCDGHFRFPSNGGRVARFTLSSEDEEDEEECEDIVVQLPAWTPPRSQRQERSRSFPRRRNPTGSGSGGLRRAVARLSATGRLLQGRRSEPSSWDGRRALEQALLIAAAVPLRASTDASGATTSTAGVGAESGQHSVDSAADTSNVIVTCSADTENAPQWQPVNTEV